MDMVAELTKQMEILAVAQAKELAVQIVAVVEQARLGVTNPAVFIWPLKETPQALLEIIPEPSLKLANWIAMVPAGVEEVPFLAEFTQVVHLADGKRIIVY